MPSALPKDATFKDLRTTRGNAERFLRNVLGLMGKVQKDHGEIVVRMGTTGTGQAPNYRIEDPTGVPIFAVDGANHQQWPEGERFEGSENWSSATMTYKDVQEILRSITGYTGAGTFKR